MLNNTKHSTRVISSRRTFNKYNNKTMNREYVFPLIVGVILGALVMIFWQFNARLANISAGVVQLDQATVRNTKTVGNIVNFINKSTKGNTPVSAGTTSKK